MTCTPITKTPTQAITVRAMRSEDLDQVIAIDRQSFSLPWPKRAFENDLVNYPNAMVWVAEYQGGGIPRTVAGMTVVWMILDEAHIATLAVHPEFRGRGIARFLLRHALCAAIRRGAKLATLEVRHSNTAAQELYRSFQFDVVGQRRKYYKDNQEDALIMTVSEFGDEYLEWLKSARDVQELPTTDIMP